MNKLTIPIRGMHCASCEILIGEQLKKISGVKDAKVSQKRGEAEVHFVGSRPSDESLAKAVQEAGYEIGQKQKLPWISRNKKDYKDLALAAIVLLILYYVLRMFGIFEIGIETQNSGIAVALLVGLVAGISTCMALIGGLVLSLSARHADLHPEATTMQKFRPHVYFNVGRILGYALFGGLIGLIGQALKPSTTVLGWLTMIIGAVMLFFGLKLIEIFPVLKDKSITLPSGIARIFGLNKEVKEYSHKSAMLVGALTFFLPCGFTQAMQLYAVSTGSFVQGMLVMGLFALGTAPGLLGIGGLTSVVKGRKARVFFMTAGLAVILFGWYNIANGSQLLNGGVVQKNSDKQTDSGQDEQVSADVQEVNMTQGATGYKPNVFTVKKGKPVKWVIKSTSSFSCASSIVMPKFGISRDLRPGQNIITFTPTQTGEIPFSCSMGMYRGKFIVVN